MVLTSVPAGEYDKRVEILTKERGRISGFARGARRPGSSVMAAASPFVFGTFKISEGRSAYQIIGAKVDNYFEKLRADITAACFGSYFMEILQYVTRENNDETALLMLAYQSLRALESDSFDNRLVRAVFEIKTVMLEGEYPGPRRGRCTPWISCSGHPPPGSTHSASSRKCSRNWKAMRNGSAQGPGITGSRAWKSLKFSCEQGIERCKTGAIPL